MHLTSVLILVSLRINTISVPKASQQSISCNDSPVRPMHNAAIDINEVPYHYFSSEPVLRLLLDLPLPLRSATGTESIQSRHEDQHK
jgi:hypothetical protein